VSADQPRKDAGAREVERVTFRDEDVIPPDRVPRRRSDRPASTAPSGVSPAAPQAPPAAKRYPTFLPTADGWDGSLRKG
jgi:hypothetical protein